MSASQRPPVAAGLRWTRAVLVAALAWGASSAAHVLAGGALPSGLFIVGLVALTAWPLSLGLAGRAGVLRVATLMAAGQALMHTALVMASWYTTGQGGLSAAGDLHQDAAMPGMDMPGAGMHDPTGVAQMSVSHMMPLLPSPFMLLAHLVAALIVGAVLADGERVLFVLLGLLAHVCAPALRRGRYIQGMLAMLAAATGPGVDLAKSPQVDLPQRRLRERVLVATLGRRGPPVHAA